MGILLEHSEAKSYRFDHVNDSLDTKYLKKWNAKKNKVSKVKKRSGVV